MGKSFPGVLFFQEVLVFFLADQKTVVDIASTAMQLFLFETYSLDQKKTQGNATTKRRFKYQNKAMILVCAF